MIEGLGPERDRELEQERFDESSHPAGGDTTSGAEAVVVAEVVLFLGSAGLSVRWSENPETADTWRGDSR